MKLNITSYNNNSMINDMLITGHRNSTCLTTKLPQKETVKKKQSK